MAATVAILLAAGESRRMGRPKALLPWQGTTLLAHQVAILREGGVDSVVVVLGHGADSLRTVLEGQAAVTWVINRDYLQGKTTSVKTGLTALGEELPAVLLILNVDQPRSPDTIRVLLRRHWTEGGLITIPTYGGKGGHPIVIDASLLDELRSIDEKTMGIKAVVRRHEESTRRVEMPTPEVLWDLNTPEDYEEALRAEA